MSKLFIPNFTIFADIPSTGFTVDPDTGNLIQSSNTLEIKSWIKQRSPKSDSDTYSWVKSVNPSADYTQVYVAGYCVIPKEIPINTLIQRKTYNATYIEPITGYEQRGRFVLAPQVNALRPRVAKALARSLGEHIEGLFQFGYLLNAT